MISLTSVIPCVSEGRMCVSVRYWLQIPAIALLLSTAAVRAQDAPATPVSEVPAIDDNTAIFNAALSQATFPTVGQSPDYWVDKSPFKMFAKESIAYNDNLLLLPNGAVSPRASRGDFYSTTSVGASGRMLLGAQTFFLNGTYGFTAYKRDTNLNASNYAVNGGMGMGIHLSLLRHIGCIGPSSASSEPRTDFVFSQQYSNRVAQ